MQYLINRANIESNKAFQRLLAKTQVLTPELGRDEVIKNRLTHSYQVATSSEIIAKSISTLSYNADYQESVYNVSLLHDIGHAPFGHAGASLMKNTFKEKGLEEGFDDNNNNLVIIKKNQIKISNYEMASIIKYPTKLYKNQEKLKGLLESAINEDITYFEKFITINNRPKRTLSCEIMDEADRNTYICDDLSDLYSLNMSDSKDLVNILANDNFLSTDVIEFLTLAIKAIDDKNKTIIKHAFNNLKLKLNQNYYLGDDLQIKPKHKELITLRETLGKVSTVKYIKSKHVKDTRILENNYLAFYIDYIFKNEFYPSTHYSKKIGEVKSEQDKLRLIRDMVADSTDIYIKQFYFDKHK